MGEGWEKNIVVPNPNPDVTLLCDKLDNKLSIGLHNEFD